MLIVQSVVGNINDEPWKSQLAAASIDWLRLDQWEAQKNRFRKTTVGGTEVAVALDRGTHLRDGDVLLWDQAPRRAIVARVELKEVMVIKIAESQDPTDLARTCLELGHAIGNQHWPAVVKGMEVYVPQVIDRNVMASVMKTHAFPGISYRFIPGSDLIPYLAPNEQRRLLGNPDGPVHSHAEEYNQAHSHDHDGQHSHVHPHGYTGEPEG